MYRAPALVLLIVVLLLAGLVTTGRLAGGVVAQEATPAAADFGPEGVTFEPLGFGTAEELPAAPADLLLARFTIEPGAGFPLDPNDPSVALFYVESGAVTVLADIPLPIIRAATIAAFATPGAVEEDAVPEAEEGVAGAEFTLEAGDSVVFPPFVEGEIRNDGDETVVGLAALVFPPEDAGATPTP
ncbi:MAG: cupin domain-containing protein [Chloroflexota bacterium]|nr:cupin domain-containing protein [Chloroflexota bacterium]